MAKIISKDRSGYKVDIAVGRRKDYVLPQVVSEMLLFLLKRANMQPDTYTFHLTNLGRFVKATSKLYMHLGAYPGQGWKVSVCFDRAEKDTAWGNLLLPKGMSKESHTVRLKKVLEQLNEDGWKDFLSSVKKEKELANKPVFKAPKEKTVAVVSVLPSNESAKVELLTGVVRKPRVTRSLTGVNFTIDLARIIEIQVRVREIDAGVQQFKVELDAYAQLNQSLNFARIIEIQDRLQQLASEVQQLVSERKVFEKAMRARTKPQLIRSILS